MPDFTSYTSITPTSTTSSTGQTIIVKGPLDEYLLKVAAYRKLELENQQQATSTLEDSNTFKWGSSGISTLPYPLITTLVPLLQVQLPAMPSTPAPTNTSNLPAASSQAANAVQWALGKVGRPYVWGSKGKDDTYDCSGLVYAAYKALGKDVPASTGAWKSSSKQKIDKYSGQPGDVIILNTNGPSRGHAMLITENLGGGKYKVVEAKSKKTGVVTSTYTVNNSLNNIYRAKKGTKLIKKPKI